MSAVTELAATIGADPRSIQCYLEGVGLPARAPPIAPARPDPQHEFDFAA